LAVSIYNLTAERAKKKLSVLGELGGFNIDSFNRSECGSSLYNGSGIIRRFFRIRVLVVGLLRDDKWRIV
jgi:hypothetical protein